MEHCKNPWKDGCKNENIKLYIEVKGEKLPICQQCWNKIADQEYEWWGCTDNFSGNSARSYIGRNVNLHLKDGAVIVNVQLTGILKGSGKNNLIEYAPYGNRKTSQIPLRNVAWADLLNSNLMHKAA